MSAQSKKKLYGVIAEYDNAAALYHAAEKIRDAGYTRWDVHSPFPIHGMDEAMGLGRSPIGYIVFCGGTAGLLTALGLQWFTAIFDYPLIVHGKPTNLIGTIPAFFPVMFELTILFSAFTAVFSLMLFTALPRWNHPLLGHQQFKKFSDDGFFAVIEARDPKFSLAEAEEILAAVGGKNISEVYDE